MQEGIIYTTIVIMWFILNGNTLQFSRRESPYLTVNAFKGFWLMLYSTMMESILMPPIHLMLASCQK
jgi:hypothetical protein